MRPERQNHYAIKAIKRLLIAKSVLKPGEVEETAKEVAHLEFEEDKKFAAEWWQQIKIGDQVQYGGYEGRVISVSPEPWQALVIQTGKKKLATFTMLDRSLLVKERCGGWTQCGQKINSSQVL